MLETNHCSRCDQDLPLDSFSPSARDRPGAYCRTCQSEYMRRYNQERNTATAWPRTCRDCGTSYERWCEGRHPIGAAFRCKSCWSAAKKRHQLRVQSMQERKRHERRNRPEPKSLGYERSQRYRAECEAGQLPCALCGEAIDYELKHPDRMSFSVDHIVPTSQGGAVTDQANLQPTHLGCNARKAHRDMFTTEPVLLMRAAMWIGQRLA